VQELDVMVFMHPNGFTGATGSPTITSSTPSATTLGLTVAVGYLVFAGVLERFPS